MTKQELRQDPVLESLQKGLGYARSNSRWVVLGVVGLVAVVAVGIMMIQGRRSAHERAALDLAQARAQLFQGNAQQARTLLQNIVTRESGTQAANEANLFLGDINMQSGQPDVAKINYEEALKRLKDPVLKTGALRGLAAALDDMGSKAEASIQYENAAGDTPSVAAVTDLMNAARTAHEAGNGGRARDLYTRCLDMARDVAQGRVNEIQAAIAELEASEQIAASPNI